jgi:hypothetical protein
MKENHKEIQVTKTIFIPSIDCDAEVNINIYLNECEIIGFEVKEVATFSGEKVPSRTVETLIYEEDLEEWVQEYNSRDEFDDDRLKVMRESFAK